MKKYKPDERCRFICYTLFIEEKYLPFISRFDEVIDDASVNRAIKIGACSIFHGCVHNMLYEKSEEILRGLYKSASFVVQAICLKQAGSYISHQNDLLERWAGANPEAFKANVKMPPMGHYGSVSAESTFL